MAAPGPSWAAVLVFLGLAAWPLIALPQGPPAAVLEPGSELERSLQGGEAHQYQLGLLAGQYCYLVVEQEGVDVAVTLRGPDGRKITTVDSMNGDQGPEPLAALAETTGNYIVVVASGPRERPAGRYKIRIVELRSPAPGDGEHIAAERAIEQARELKSSGGGNGRDAAIAKLQEALHYYATAGAPDQDRHGLVLFSIGYLQAQKSHARESIASYLAALPLFQAAGDTVMEARTRNNLGGEYHDLGEPQKALQYHREALAMLPAGQALKLQAAIQNNLGVLYEEMGDWTAALDFYERAASGFGATGDWREQAIAWRNLAYVYRHTNEPEQGLLYLEQARQLLSLKSVSDPSLQAEVLTNRAEILLSQEQPAEALKSCEEALKFRRVAGDLRREGDTLSVAGSIYRALQQPDRARQAFEDALSKQHEADYQFGVFRTLLEMGTLDLSMRQIAPARAELDQALQIAGALGCAECKARAEFSLARLLRASGNLPESLRQIRDTIATLEGLHAGIGPAALRASFLGGHGPAYEFYIDMALHDPAQGAAANSAQSFTISEHAHARALLETLSGMRTGLGDEDDPLAKREQAVRDELAWNAGKLVKLWQDSAARAGGSSRKADEVEVRLGQLEAEYNLIEAQKAGKDKGYAALAQPRYLSPLQVQQELLDDQTLFLEYYLGDEKSYLWAIARNAVFAYELPPRSQVEAACRRVYELLSRRNPIDGAMIHATSELSDMVLGPVAEKLKDLRLVVVADGALQYIPFAALNQPGLGGEYQPLMLTHEIVHAPSASAMAAEREFLAQRGPAERNLAIFADPVFSAKDPRIASRTDTQTGGVSGPAADRLLHHTQSGNPGDPIARLPFTAMEANRILALMPARPGLKAMGFDATRELALSPVLGEYKYLHFATHGYIDSRHPELSALVLSLVDRSGNVQDGFLRLQDIYRLRLHADLVVLSACETGLGQEIRGEGLIGLTRGFMYAGAARVLVSLWDVSDQGAAELMPVFYRSMLGRGRSAAAALREAQIAMFKNPQWQDPYYWAPFTLQGEWK